MNEKIELHFKDNVHFEDQIPEGFEFMTEQHVSFDREKGSQTKEIVLLHISDIKFFKSTMCVWGRGVLEYYNDWKECFPVNMIHYE